MTQAMEKVGESLQAAYDEQYTDTMTEWREIGGKYKANNILSVCNGKTFFKVLDCGAGEGSILKFLDESDLSSEFYAIEISDSGIEQIKKRNLQRLKGVMKFNGYEIPYSENYFGLSYCSHVIEHVEHPRLLLRELMRVSEFQVFEIPLDYSLNIDRKVQHFLSYGHINVYTPSLFRFLLKSEGLEILAERLTHTAKEIIRFNWYQNIGRSETHFNNLKIKMLPARNAFMRIVHGRRRHEEYDYSAYTCLVRRVGELKIL
jgi:ubiquinone/menaquinone biosynthesis C-methylase UbiE